MFKFQIPYKFRRTIIISLLIIVASIFSLIAIYSHNKDNLLFSISEFFDNKNNGPSLLEHLTIEKLDESPADGEYLKIKVGEHISQKANQISQNFYSPLIEQFYSLHSEIPKIKLKKDANQAMGKLINKKELLGYLQMNDTDVEKFKLLHAEIYESLPDKFPNGLYRGTGIVFIAGGSYTWLTLLSIKSLRSFGCELPIEVIIPTNDEYEHGFCEDILPILNAKCIVLGNVLGEEIMSSVKFKGYQFKSLALIASSFDNTLLLDSDNILVSNPTEFFKQEPYKSKGLVIWPDYWKRTTSPHFYEIAGIEVNETVRVREGKWDLVNPQVLEPEEAIKYDYHDFKGTLPDVSSESGQLLIRKTDHVKTLLLSFIYNLYGPGFFYKFISQGNTGEGDKDTFIAAAVKANEKFYQVKSAIYTFGWHGKGFHGVAMGQRDPVSDFSEYNIYLKESKKYEKRLAKARKQAKGDEEVKEKKPSFNPDNKVNIFTVHSNFPKLNPLKLLKDNKLKDGDRQIRMYGDISRVIFDNKYDFEFVQFRRMKFLLCDINLNLKQFNDISRNQLCGFIEEHLKFLEANPVVKSSN